MHQLVRPALLVIGLLGFLSASPAADQPRSPKDPGTVDCVAVGDPESGKAHDMAIKGAVTNETVNAEIGTLREKYPVATLGGRGSELSFSLRVSRPKSSAATPVVLEVQ